LYKKKLFITIFFCVSTSLFLQAQILQLPARSTNAIKGKQFAAFISSLTRDEREAVIYSQFIGGNVPEFLRKLVTVEDSMFINGTLHKVTYFVTMDYLSLGANDDYLLMPMTPLLAQKIANALGCSLPTKKMVDRIYSSADLKLRPQPIAPSAAMITVMVFTHHNDSVQTLRKQMLTQFPLSKLIGGTKKDVIISNSIYNNLKPNVSKPVVIYGWHKLNGNPIQPVYNGHEETYADYSHGIRLVKDSIIVDGESKRIIDVLSDPNLCYLISDEGVISNPKYFLKQKR
jgi:hypothetical protein